MAFCCDNFGALKTEGGSQGSGDFWILKLRHVVAPLVLAIVPWAVSSLPAWGQAPAGVSSVPPVSEKNSAINPSAQPPLDKQAGTTIETSAKPQDASAAGTGSWQTHLVLHGSAKYGENAPSLDYAQPAAPKGGRITIGLEGSFDSLNPFSLRGDAPSFVRSLVFQDLGDQTMDEPFSVYPMIAKGFSLAEDRKSLRIKIYPEARFNDGSRVTAEDVKFSFETLISDKAGSFYRFYWADISKVEVLSQDEVKFIYKEVNAELPLISMQMPLLSKAYYGKDDFGQAFATKILGSGPYRVKDYKAGSFILFERDKNFWAQNLLLNRGRYNFDEIMIKYYKDSTSLVEGFKKGDFDVYFVNSAKVWALDLAGEKFEKKWIKKDFLPNSNNQGVQGFGFNLRRPLFQDARVRKAFSLAFDFAWANKNLFYDQYIESKSFFENSPLKATGRPSPEELAVLEPLKADLPNELFTEEMGWLSTETDIRKRLRTAALLLKEAGYQIKDGVAVGPHGPLRVKFLLQGTSFQRVLEPYVQNLKKIGIEMELETKEDSVYVRRINDRDFDMMVISVGQSQSPGNEQKDQWSSEAADAQGSNNLLGLKNKAIDALVQKVIYARTREELVLMVRCLDRALYHQHLLVHNWYAAAHRIAYWNKIGMPTRLPAYYSLTQFFEYMWTDPEKLKRLNEATARGQSLESLK